MPCFCHDLYCSQFKIDIQAHNQLFLYLKRQSVHIWYSGTKLAHSWHSSTVTCLVQTVKHTIYCSQLTLKHTIQPSCLVQTVKHTIQPSSLVQSVKPLISCSQLTLKHTISCADSQAHNHLVSVEIHAHNQLFSADTRAHNQLCRARPLFSYKQLQTILVIEIKIAFF